jgi:hypothetical protein
VVIASRRDERLARNDRHIHALTVFVVTDAQAAMIRATYAGGEFSAAVELRQLFLGITDNAQARLCVRTIACRRPLPHAAASYKTARQ